MLVRKALFLYAQAAVFHACEMLLQADFRPAWKQILGALRLDSGLKLTNRANDENSDWPR